VKKLVF